MLTRKLFQARMISIINYIYPYSTLNYNQDFLEKCTIEKIIGYYQNPFRFCFSHSPSVCQWPSAVKSRIQIHTHIHTLFIYIYISILRDDAFFVMLDAV